jgi:hypothetical protein
MIHRSRHDAAFRSPVRQPAAPTCLAHRGRSPPVPVRWVNGRVAVNDSPRSADFSVCTIAILRAV